MFGFCESLIAWEVKGSDKNSSLCRYLLRYLFSEHFLAWSCLYLKIYLSLASCTSSDNCQIRKKAVCVTFAQLISNLCTLAGMGFHGYRIKHNLAV
jgi:hypothetical protein